MNFGCPISAEDKKQFPICCFLLVCITKFFWSFYLKKQALITFTILQDPSFSHLICLLSVQISLSMGLTNRLWLNELQAHIQLFCLKPPWPKSRETSFFSWCLTTYILHNLALWKIDYFSLAFKHILFLLLLTPTNYITGYVKSADFWIRTCIFNNTLVIC